MKSSDSSYKKSIIPLYLEVRPSRAFQAVSLTLHGAAIFAITQTALELQWIGLIITGILISAYFSHRLGQRSYRLNWREDKRWEIRFSCGDKRTGKMLGGTMFNPLITVLALRTGPSRKDYILIPRDSMPRGDYTRLQARLRVEAAKAISEGI